MKCHFVSVMKTARKLAEMSQVLIRRVCLCRHTFFLSEIPFRLSDEDGAIAHRKRSSSDLAGLVVHTYNFKRIVKSSIDKLQWSMASCLPFFGHTVNLWFCLFTRKSSKAFINDDNFQLRAPVFELGLMFYFRSKYGSTQLAVNPGSVGRPLLCKLQYHNHFGGNADKQIKNSG